MDQVIIIGGGAAGMAAAYAASFHIKRVLLLERNEKLGKKIYITGKGRGNLTNDADIGDFFENVVTNPKFLYSSLYGFSNRQLLETLGGFGLETKVERGGRVFPSSDHASDITAAWTRALRSRGVTVRLNAHVKELLTVPENDSDEKSIESRITGVRLENGETIMADHVIVATGGLSYASTGSTGDGISFAKNLGIRVTPPIPALVPLTTVETDIYALQGVSLKNVTLSLFDDTKRVYEGFGEMLFTHFGISGPIVLSASSLLAEKIAGRQPSPKIRGGRKDGGKIPVIDAATEDVRTHKGTLLRAEIDFKPRLSDEDVDRRLLSIIDERPKQAYRRFYEGLLPRGLHEVMVARSKIDMTRRIGTLRKEERHVICDLLKHFCLTINGTRGFREAIITHGGISVRELDPQTMRAKRFFGLSFAGETIDVDALTGGYNMQIAFSTGIAAGNGLVDIE